jgi:hypothetical protein
MRRFQIIEPLYDRDGELMRESLYITVSEAWVRRMYYPHWRASMIFHWCKSTDPNYQPNIRADQITFEHCLEDWVVTNWAIEL